jgi:hypothetical protein
MWHNVYNIQHLLALKRFIVKNLREDYFMFGDMVV